MSKKVIQNEQTKNLESQKAEDNGATGQTEKNTVKDITETSHPVEGQDWVYSDIVKDHFLNPRNYLMGDEKKFEHNAVGQVGNPICGDQMRMYLQIKNDKIVDIRWKTYGCASAIASTSALSELVKGKSLEDALKVDAHAIDDYLGNLPKHKFHCSILGHDALRSAIESYRSGNPS